MNSKITAIAYHLPTHKVLSAEIEDKISDTFPDIPCWIIEEMTGVQTRYFADASVYPSDLATLAAQKALESFKIQKQDIDLLIFASASQDITEPATANIVQKNLWILCPVFDIKNACNSFMNALDIADSYIKSGKYKNILICSGETPSKAIRYDVTSKDEMKQYFAGYTLGDAGAAIILSASDEKGGVLGSYFYSDGNSWDTATILGGGARFGNDISKNYFSWNPAKIRDTFLHLEYSELFDIMKQLWWEKQDIKKVFVHQVAMSNFEHMYMMLGLEKEKFHVILPETGNIASCCIVTSLARSFEAWELKAGDKIILIGFASGFSYGVIFYEV